MGQNASASRFLGPISTDMDGENGKKGRAIIAQSTLQSVYHVTLLITTVAVVVSCCHKAPGVSHVSAGWAPKPSVRVYTCLEA